MIQYHFFTNFRERQEQHGIVVKKMLLLVCLLVFFTLKVSSQVPVVTIDLRAASDTSITIPHSNSIKRESGTTCGVPSGNANCIVFNVILNPLSDQISFDILGAGGSLSSTAYQINCAPQTALSTPICLNGVTSVSISFCKTGNNPYDYKITASTLVKGSPDLTLRENCSGTMSVTGLQAASVNWTSISPGTPGQYNGYLSNSNNVSGVNYITVTPGIGAPTSIDYRVSGSTASCGIAKADTIRVNTTPALTVPITPLTPAICSGAAVTLTASPSGGNPPYTYSWTGGSTIATTSVTVAGTYTVTVNDNTVGCAAVAASKTVAALPTPVAPTAPGTTICAGGTATITASAPGGTYKWYDASGTTLLFTGNSYTTPVLSSTTSYLVETTVSGCTSPRRTVTVTVTPTPAAPSVTGATICAGNTANLTATAAGTLDWYTASSGGSFLQTGGSYTTPVLNTSTTYYVQTTVSGCSSTRTPVTATVTPIPAAPTAPSAAICNGNSITLTATAPGGTYTWYDAASGGSQLQTGSSYTTPVLTANATYSVQTIVAGCNSSRTVVNVSVNSTPPAPTVATVGICINTTGTLNVSSPLTGVTYEWYANNSGGSPIATGTSYTTPTLNTTSNYYVQANLAGCSSSSRVMATVTVSNVPSAPVASGVTICAGNTASLTGAASGTIDWYDAASAGSLLQTGNNFTTPVLNASALFYVQTTVSGCASPRTTVSVTVNSIPSAPVAANAAICAGSTAVLTATAPGGAYDWYTVAAGGSSVHSGASFSTPVLNAPATYYVETTVSGCISSRTTVTVSTNSIPAVPAVSVAAVCAGNTATAAIISPLTGISYQWYDAPSSGNLVATGNSFTTPALSDDINYYVQANLSGCNSNRATVSVPVIQAPAAPTAAAVFICTGNSTVITATSPGGNYEWYDAVTGGNFLAAGSNYTTPVLTTTTQYYVQTTVSGCTGLRSAVTVNVNPAPAAPTVLGNTICAGSNSSLTATSPGGTYQWFDAASGGNLLLTGPSYITPLLNSTTNYYVQTTVAGCTGSRTLVTVSVLPAPAAPTVANAVICAGSAASLPASAPGGTYQWYDAASGGNLLYTGSVFTTPILNTTTVYYVQTTVGTCTGQRTGATVTVNTIPAAPNATGATICAGNTTTLTAAGSGGSYEWYDAMISGNLLANGSNFITPVLNATTVYYVQSTVAGCTGSRTAVTASVLPVLQPAFNYSSGTFCVSGSNATPVILAGNGGSFSATPAGLVFVNTHTGEINVAASALGTYTIQFTTAGPCVYNSSANVTITNSPNASFTYSGPYCPQQSMAMPAFSTGASAGVFSSGSPGIVFNSSSTGEIDLQKSTPGTYTITNNIAASNGCAAASATNTVTILSMPVVNAGIDQTVCVTNTVSLNGSIAGTATKANWSGGAGSFTDASQLITQYQPAVGESLVKLYLTTDDPSGPCVAATDSLIIRINPAPVAPTVQNASVCTGNTATLVATAPGGIYEWFTTASGGGAISTGNTFTSASLSATSTYYVQSTVNSCTGPRTAVTINVASRPVITSPASGEVCSANPFTYLITSDQAGTSYTWGRSLVTGISNPSSGGQTDSTITEVLNNTSNNAVPVTYSIVPNNKGCIGDPFFYTVSIKPTPVAPAISNSTPVCAGTPLNLFTNTIAGASYQWSGPNGFSSVQQNPVLNNVTTASAGIYQLIITVNNCSSSPSSKNIAPVIAAPAANSNSPLCEQSTLQLTAGGLAGASYSWKGPGGFSSLVQNPSLSAVKPTNAGMYYVTASIAGCTGLTDSVQVTVNIPPSKPLVFSNSPVCSSDSITLHASNISSNASLQWSGPGGFKSSLPSLSILRAEKTNEGEYNLTVSTPGCVVTNASATSVLVNQKPQINSIGNNSPVCEGGTLLLNATSLPGAVFSWSSLSGYSASAQNPVLNNVTKSNEEIYRAVVNLNGCASDTAVTKVVIVKAATADPGSSRTVCANNASFTLSGNITGEDTQTGTWSTDGGGSFLPNANQLSAIYVPDKTDTVRRKVVLTLSTSNNKVCPVQSSRIEVNILPSPVVNAGPDQSVCANDSLVMLQGTVANAGGANWLSSGSGVFRQNSSSLTNVYVPSRQDIQRGTVNFYLRSNNNGNCIAVSDTVQYRIQAVPFVNAGNDLVVYENESIRLSPTVTGNGLQFLWTPSINLSSDIVQNPILTGKTNQEYTIQVTGTGSCIASDKLFIRVLKPFIIPNIFSPNGDGVHDVWSIPELANYPGAVVEIFTRTGIKIFSSVGYERPWDGTYNGQPVPVATYYYIIRPNFRDLLFSGSVTIIR